MTQLILALHDDGKSNAEIAAEITACGCTHHDIDLGELFYMMNFRDMLTKEVGNDAAKKWHGSVLDMKAAVEASGNADALAAIDRWLSHITNPRNATWQTSKPEYSAQFYALYQLFNNPPNDQIFNEGDLDAIYALGGGRIEVTEAEVADIIAQAERDEALSTVHQRHNAGSTAAQLAHDNNETPEAIIDAAAAAEGI